MSRDQRSEDNWALLYAQELALERAEPLAVVFCLVPVFLAATIRQYEFMVDGLREVARNLKNYDIPFFLLEGCPHEVLPGFVKTHNIGVLVTDFDPLRVKQEWKEHLEKKISIPLYEVDARNIVPCWAASTKQE